MRRKIKRFYLWIALLLTMFILCGCQGKGSPSIYDVTRDGKTYTVDQEQGTITCDEIVYQFKVSRSGDYVNVDFIYPDNSKYSWRKKGNVTSAGWTDDYDPIAQNYVQGDVLRDILEIQSPGQNDSGLSLVLTFLLLAIGAFLVITPQTAWMLKYGWRFKNAEASDLALIVNRILGAVILFIGVICLLGVLL